MLSGLDYEVFILQNFSCEKLIFCLQATKMMRLA